MSEEKMPPQTDIASEAMREGTFEQVSFKGETGEYFKIWIVNISLTVLTLGIYSAWAKVRRISYFHNKTEIDGHAFTYHATGGKILIGRLIVVGLLVAYNLTSQFFPIAGVILSIAFIFFWPWAINKSLKFNARYTSWRNVRFDWHGDYTRTFIYTVLAPIGSILSAGLLVPFFAKHYYRYYAESHSFGTKRFVGNPRTKNYYKAFFLMVIMPLPLFWFIAFVFTDLYVTLDTDGAATDSFKFWLSFTVLGALTPILIIPFNTACRNLLLNSLALDEKIKFKSTLSPLRFLWITISNAAAIVFSFGLLSAWAHIRRYTYLSNCTYHNMPPGMDDFVDTEKEAMATFGEELADLNDLDIGI